MRAKGNAWMVATSVRAVEALKDEGFARWNYPLTSLKQHAETNLRSMVQANKLSSSSDIALSKVRDDKMNESVESRTKVMYLSFWGPN